MHKALKVQPVDSAAISAAKKRDWEVILALAEKCPRHSLATFAAAGANVTSFDNSTVELAKYKLVADRDDLEIHLMQGNMAELSCFEDAPFDLIFHPV